MALSILDGNQSATTLSTILSSGQHITAHTVVSLGTQAITDMRGAVSGSVVSISNLPATQPISIASVTIGNTVTIAGTVTANPTGTQTIAGTVTANAVGYNYQESSPALIPLKFDGSDTFYVPIGPSVDPLPIPISGTVDITALPAGTNRIGVVTIGAGTVTLGASTSQIGSVTASISNSVVTIYPMQGTSVSNTNFTSTTASTTLVSAVANREVLTVFNEGAGNLHISAGATCTTVAYQVRLSAGDYWECPQGQLSLAHTAVFATAGTARVTQVS
jgi:hypothetical protein